MGYAVIDIIFGFPMGVITTIQKEEFSMYLAAPLLSVVLIIILAIPKLWEKIIQPEEE